MKCLNCNEEIREFNFCPHCGSANSEIAKKIESTRTVNTRLETLAKLLELVDDEKTLKIIEKFILNLKK
jgi:hypothetical protein